MGFPGPAKDGIPFVKGNLISGVPQIIVIFENASRALLFSGHALALLVRNEVIEGRKLLFYQVIHRVGVFSNGFGNFPTYPSRGFLFENVLPI